MCRTWRAWPARRARSWRRWAPPTSPAAAPPWTPRSPPLGAWLPSPATPLATTGATRASPQSGIHCIQRHQTNADLREAIHLHPSGPSRAGCSSRQSRWVRTSGPSSSRVVAFSTRLRASLTHPMGRHMAVMERMQGVQGGASVHGRRAAQLPAARRGAGGAAARARRVGAHGRARLVREGAAPRGRRRQAGAVRHVARQPHRVRPPGAGAGELIGVVDDCPSPVDRECVRVSVCVCGD